MLHITKDIHMHKGRCIEPDIPTCRQGILLCVFRPLMNQYEPGSIMLSMNNPSSACLSPCNHTGDGDIKWTRVYPNVFVSCRAIVGEDVLVPKETATCGLHKEHSICTSCKTSKTFVHQYDAGRFEALFETSRDAGD